MNVQHSKGAVVKRCNCVVKLGPELPVQCATVQLCTYSYTHTCAGLYIAIGIIKIIVTYQ